MQADTVTVAVSEGLEDFPRYLCFSWPFEELLKKH